MTEAELQYHLQPWAPAQCPLPEEWMALAVRLSEQIKGTLRTYILGVKYNATNVGNLLRSWGLPLDVVMAGYLWEYDEGKQQIRQTNLPDADLVLAHISEADLYARYIEEDNLPPLLTPPYHDLGALLIAVAIYYEALHILAQKSAEPNRGEKLLHMERVGHTLLNITKRLGMWNVKRNIEDLIEQLRNPQQFAEDTQEHQRILRQSRIAVEQACQIFKEFYRETTGQSIEVTYSPCGVTGLKRRLQDAHTTATSQKTELTGFDLVTFDIIVPTVQNCYQAFGALSQLGHIQDRVTDLITNPKPNGCSHIALGLVLNTEELGINGIEKREVSPSPVCQIEISTPIMQAISQYGCLHPSCYTLFTANTNLSMKEPPLPAQIWNSDGGKVFQAICDSFDGNYMQPDTAAPIVVHSKNRSAISLPKGATALDFAFAIDPTIGERAVEAFINNRKAPLNRVLDASDIIEILTSPDIQVQESWLEKNYAITSLARKYIQESLSKRFLDRKGYTLLHEELERQDYILTPEELTQELRILIKQHKLGTLQSYLEQVDETGEKKYTSKWAAQEIIQQIKMHKKFLPYGTNRSNWIAIVNEPMITKRKVFYRQHFCNSCRPQYPRDTQLMGLLKQNGELVVHTQTCPYLLTRTNGHNSQLLTMIWQSQPPAFKVAFFVIAQDRSGLIYDLTRELRRHQCVLINLHAEAVLKFKEAHIRLTIEAYSDEEVLNILQQIARIDGVIKAAINASDTSRHIYERLQKQGNYYPPFPITTIVRESWEEAIATLQSRNFVLKNPYDISRPATAKMFFGRSQENQFMQRELCEGERGKAVILYGPRRSGKSSICKNFLERYIHQPYWGVLFSLQNVTQLTEETLFMQLADKIGREFQEQLQQTAPEWQDYHDSDPQLRFRRFVQECIARVPDTRLVLALDEFGGALESYDQGTLKRGFFTFWKELISDIPQLSLIFALPTSSHHTLTSRKFVDAFSFATNLPMAFLDKESAERLLVDPLRDQQIVIHPNTIALVTTLTGGNPYYITLIGQQLIHYLNRDIYKQKVTDEELHMIVNSLIEESGFHQNFDFHSREIQSGEELRVLESIVELTNASGQPQVRLKKIAAKANLPVSLARRHLERLRTGLILQQSGQAENPYYSFTIELVRRWLGHNHWFFSQT